MSVIIPIFVIGLFWALPTYVTGRLGKRLGLRNAWMYGFFLSWLGFGVLAMRAPRAAIRQTERSLADGSAVAAMDKFAPAFQRLLGTEQASQRRCPECAEVVQEAAKVCKHCGHRLDTPSTAGLAEG